MEDGRILNSQITASSFDHWAPPYYGRLNYNGCWFSSRGGPYWLQVNMLNRTLIKGVATQGSHNFNHFTRTYQLSYSNDGTDWTIYEEKGIVKVCLIFLSHLYFNISNNSSNQQNDMYFVRSRSWEYTLQPIESVLSHWFCDPGSMPKKSLWLCLSCVSKGFIWILRFVSLSP